MVEPASARILADKPKACDGSGANPANPKKKKFRLAEKRIVYVRVDIPLGPCPKVLTMGGGA
jgi:hypothetical protein